MVKLLQIGYYHLIGNKEQEHKTNRYRSNNNLYMPMDIMSIKTNMVSNWMPINKLTNVLNYQNSTLFSKELFPWNFEMHNHI